MEIFYLTDDGKYVCIRHNGTLHYQSSGDYALMLYHGITYDELDHHRGKYGPVPDGFYRIEIDQGASERETKRLRRRVPPYTHEKHWGYD